MPFWFLATPYSKYPYGVDAAFHLAARARGLLLQCGVIAYSPIAECHPIAIECDLDPLDHTIWLPACAPLRKSAYGLIILRAESWEDSAGMKAEIKEFEDAGKPVRFMDPGKITLELLTSLQFQRPETSGYCEVFSSPLPQEKIDELMRKWQTTQNHNLATKPIVWGDLKAIAGQNILNSGAAAAVASLDKMVDTIMEDIKPAAPAPEPPAATTRLGPYVSVRAPAEFSTPDPEPEPVPPEPVATLPIGFLGGIPSVKVLPLESKPESAKSIFPVFDLNVPMPKGAAIPGSYNKPAASEPEPEPVPLELQVKLFKQSVADIGECLVTLSDILQQGFRADNEGRRGGVACGLERAAAHVRGERYIPVVDPKHVKNKTGN